MNDKEFKKIVEKYQNLIFTICFQFIKDYQEAQNLTQETFISAYKNIDNCNLCTIKPWLSKIAVNKAKDYLKSAYNRRVVFGTEYEKENLNINNFLLHKNNIPENIIISNENFEYIKNYIFNLREPYLNVAILYFLEEKTIEEISTILKRPKKTVQTQIYRARSILKQYIDKEE